MFQSNSNLLIGHWSVAAVGLLTYCVTGYHGDESSPQHGGTLWPPGQELIES